MKRLKSIWMTLLIVILSMAMLIGGTNIIAFAATDAGSAVLNDKEIPTQFVYGTSYTVDKDIVVIAPNGSEEGTVNGNDKTFSANQVGIYTLQTMSNDNVAAEYFVKCSLKDNFELRVDNNGAQIPTYIKKDGKFKLPSATLYKEVEDEWEPVIGADIKITVDNVTKVAGDEIVCSEARAMYINYYVKVDGGNKFISKDFTVKVQENFEDGANPSLGVVNFPNELNIYSKVTIPTATVTDDFDENVEVKITVKDPDGALVKTVSVNKDGYGYIDEAASSTYSEIKFDNNKVMSFYPVKEGYYITTYVAIDDSGKESATYTYRRKCLDTTAPVLKDIKDSDIPETWGVAMGKDSQGQTIDSEINFPMPKYVDNNGKKDDSQEGISVSFEIYDTVNKVTVVKFSNIYDKANGGNKYKYDANASSKGVYDKSGAAEHVFGDSGFEFDFAKYEVDAGKTKTGKYTVTYQAKDAKNTSTKTYNITLEDNYSDEAKPSVTVDFASKHIYVTDVKEEFLVPAPIVKDTKDARPAVVYTLTSGSSSIEVKGGEKGKVYIDNGKSYLAIKDKDVLEITGGKLSYSVIATDDAKNVSDEAKGDIAVITADTFSGFTPAVAGSLEQSLDVAQSKNVGNLTFEIGESFKDYRNYIGFELTLYSPAGDVLDGLDFETYYNPTDKKVHVDNITFTPSVATAANESYKLVARNFTISGKSSSQIYTFTVTGSNNPSNPDISSGKLPSNGSVNVTYTLNNETYKPTAADNMDPNKAYLVRRITNAGRMSLMGTQFTAYTSGSVSFTDGIYQSAANGGAFKKIANTYTAKISQNTTPSFEVQGVIPGYSAKDAKIDLPAVTAYADNANAKIEFTVKTPTKTFTDKDAGKYGLEYNAASKLYAFTPSEDGTYTITYTASVGSGKTESATYTIKVGDVVPPTFTVEAAHTKDVAINSTFKFKKLTVGSGDDLKDVHITKKLVSIDNEVVYSVSGYANEVADKLTNGSDKNNDADAYKFTKSGPYTVVYEVKDKVGNTSVSKYTVNVSGVKSSSNISTKTISVILIIVGVLLIAGVILYFIRFRKVKPKNEK